MPVILRDIQGLSTEEASAVLRVKPQTLKSRLHRGRLILREHLGEFAGGLDAAHARRRIAITNPNHWSHRFLKSEGWHPALVGPRGF